MVSVDRRGFFCLSRDSSSFRIVFIYKLILFIVEDTEVVTKELENQYNQGMEHRLTGGRKGHIGLGFHEEETSKEPDSSEGAEAKSELKSDQNEMRGGGSDDMESVAGDSDDKNKSESKTESSNKHKLPDDDSKEEVESPTAIKKMKFVKSSS